MIQNTLNWYNGELFEAKFILGFGIFLLISSLLFYYLGNTPTTKALLIPTLVIGIISTATGVNMIYSNGKRYKKLKLSTIRIHRNL